MGAAGAAPTGWGDGHRLSRRRLVGGLGGLAALAARPTVAAPRPRPPADVPLDHIIVLYLENHTFDNLYGLFPGANGLAQPGARITQVDQAGRPYATLPRARISLRYDV